MHKEETIRPRRTEPYSPKLVAAIPLSLAFAFAGTWAIMLGIWHGVWVVLFGAAGLAAGVFHVWPGRIVLNLNDDGFTVREGRHVESYRWADIADFGLGKFAGDTIVGFNFVPTYHPNPDGRAALKAETGFESFLPSSFGKRAKELVKLMNQRRAEALRRTIPV